MDHREVTENRVEALFVQSADSRRHHRHRLVTIPGGELIRPLHWGTHEWLATPVTVVSSSRSF